MLSTRIIGLACAVAVFVCLMAATVFAQPFDKRTLFSFSAPVALPGVTLPAGQYLFRLADPHGTNKVVQVLNADGTKPYGLFFTIPAERFEPAATPEVRFIETAAGTPAAIRTWWYPGQRTGYEFIYPKEQARRLAMGGGSPVLTTQAQTTATEQTNTSELTRVGSSGQETQVSATTAPAASTPTGGTQEGQIASSSISIATPTVPAVASAGGAVPPNQTASTSRARTELPRTASQAPLVAMVGTVALTTAATLRYWRTRRR
jgi:hypothetical protein